MVKVEVKEDNVKRAKKRIQTSEILTTECLHKYGSEIERIFDGFIGEEVVLDYFGIIYCEAKLDYDFIYKGLKYEVKTISCGSKPKPSYLATINSSRLDEHRKQKCDRIIFTRLLFSHQFLWICGYINKDEFWDNAHLVKKGETYQGIEFKKAPAAVLPISRLNPVGEIFHEDL